MNLVKIVLTLRKKRIKSYKKNSKNKYNDVWYFSFKKENVNLYPKLKERLNKELEAEINIGGY